MMIINDNDNYYNYYDDNYYDDYNDNYYDYDVV